MTPEEKQLLLIDLCARLPHGVKVNLHNEVQVLLGYYGYYDNYVMLTANVPTGQQTNIVNIKPYLRPMSSMTEEEYKSVSWESCSHTFDYSVKSGFRFVEIKTFTLNILNWLNEHHFDYRGLIEKGLALEAPEGMYKIE